MAVRLTPGTYPTNRARGGPEWESSWHQPLSNLAGVDLVERTRQKPSDDLTHHELLCNHLSITYTTSKPPIMSEAYERERQNNARLDELSAKVSALRGVTVDIYDNARAQDVIDNTVRSLPRRHLPLANHHSPTPSPP